MPTFIISDIALIIITVGINDSYKAEEFSKDTTTMPLYDIGTIGIVMAIYTRNITTARRSNIATREIRGIRKNDIIVENNS